MIDQTDHSSISFDCAIDPKDHTTYVHWQQGQYEGYWETSEAIAKGTALILVAGISLAEANIMMGLLLAFDLEPGTEEYEAKCAQTLQLIRSSRVDLPSNLKPIFGYKTQQPLVEIGWYKTARTVSIEGALEEAQIILEAANAAITDSLLDRSMAGAGIKDRFRQKVFDKMREIRP